MSVILPGILKKDIGKNLKKKGKKEERDGKRKERKKERKRKKEQREIFVWFQVILKGKISSSNKPDCDVSNTVSIATKNQ